MKNEKDICKKHKFSIKDLESWHADLLVTHACGVGCKFCIDAFVDTSSNVTNLSDIEDYLRFLAEVEKKNHPDMSSVLILGGEPTKAQFDYLKKVAELIHYYGFNAAMTTNGQSGEKLFELDGYIDFITFSNYGKGILPFDNMDYLYKFEKSTITISKLITKQYFKTFEDFDKFVDLANELPFNYDFSTIQEITPDFSLYRPEWVEEKLLPLCENQDVRGNVGAVLYKGRLIKLPHVHLQRKEDICTLKLYPNGNLSTTWKNDNNEIEYKKIINKLLEKNI